MRWSAIARIASAWATLAATQHGNGHSKWTRVQSETVRHALRARTKSSNSAGIPASSRSAHVPARVTPRTSNPMSRIAAFRFPILSPLSAPSKGDPLNVLTFGARPRAGARDWAISHTLVDRSGQPYAAQTSRADLPHESFLRATSETNRLRSARRGIDVRSHEIGALLH
jgi:hypothetical protein